MKYDIRLNLAIIAFILNGALVGARAETIAQGVSSTTTAATPGTAEAGTIDSAYVTAIFGNNAYVQDSTGGIYAFAASKTGNVLNGLTIGTSLLNLGGGNFSYYTGGTPAATQFEYATTSGNFTLGSSTAGTPASIPASYYTTLTTAGLTSSANQGSATSEGIQNQLVTLNNVVITPSGTASATTFTSSGSYTMTDAFGTAVLFINSASGLKGTAVPTGPVSVSGIFQDYEGASELLPRGTYDLVQVPEPKACFYLLAGFGALLLRRWQGA